MFSLAHYEAVAGAYLRGLSRNQNPRQVASVASFFVSRVDTKVDQALEKIGTPAALALRGKIGIANSKRVYRRFKEIFRGEQFREFERRGARVQRPLWASTGTKNPGYPDTYYVDELIAPNTVNTVPPATYTAVRDHGNTAVTIEKDLDGARATIAKLAEIGIDLAQVTQQLQDEGVGQFMASFDTMTGSITAKQAAITSGVLERMKAELGSYTDDVKAALKRWKASHGSGASGARMQHFGRTMRLIKRSSPMHWAGSGSVGRARRRACSVQPESAQ